MKRHLGAWVVVVLASLVGVCSTAAAQDNPGKMVVVVSPLANTPPAMANDLQEVLIAALADREGLVLIGKDELKVQGKFDSDDAVQACLLDTECEKGLRASLNIKVFVLGQIEQTPEAYKLTILLLREDGKQFSKIYPSPADKGIEGLMEQTFDIAAALPITGPIPEKVAAPVDNGGGTDPNAGTKKGPVEPQRSLGGLGWTGIGVGGAGVISLILSAVFYSQHNTAKADLDDLLASPQVRAGADQSVTRAEAKALEDDLNSAAQATNLTLGVGVGLLVVGGALLAYDLADSPGEAAPAGGTPPSDGPSVQVAPMLGPDTAGGMLRLSF